MIPADSDGGGFGRVKRTRGVAFRYLALAASNVGILALASLIAFVVWDAFGLWSAGIGWYSIFGVTVVVPLAAFVVYASKHPPVATAGLELLSATLGGLMGAVMLVVMVLVVAGSGVWFAYVVTVAAPIALLQLIGATDPTVKRWTSVLSLVTIVLGPIAGTLLLGPLSTVAALLGAPGVFFCTIVVPAAGVLWYTLERRYEYGRRVSIAAAVALPVIAIVAVPIVDRIAIVSRSAWLVLLVSIGIPVAVATANTARDPDRRGGFALPVIVVGGLLVGRLLVDLLDGVVPIIDVSRPQPWFDWQFLTSAPSTSIAEVAGMYPQIVGSIFLIVVVAVLTFGLGVGAAIYLEEYAPSGGWAGRIVRFIRINISNLAGVPSVVYGLLGLGIFVQMRVSAVTIGPLTIGPYTGFGVGTVISAAFTLSLLILPIVIISAQEAIQSVPDSMREASYGMGATRWQTIRNVVIPESMGGILTGTILALGRAIGETAPLLLIGAAAVSFSPPTELFGTLTAMPLLVYRTAFFPADAFRHGVTAAGVVTLLLILLTINSIAIVLRDRFETEA
ncbi:MAG: phosphate ABC transporter permease PstA [Halococcoides sp.]